MIAEKERLRNTGIHQRVNDLLCKYDVEFLLSCRQLLSKHRSFPGPLVRDEISVSPNQNWYLFNQLM